MEEKPIQNPAANHPGIPGRVSLEEALEAYGSVVSRFGYSPVLNPGRIEILGWDLEYVCGAALANFIDQILVRRDQIQVRDLGGHDSRL